MSQTFKRTYVVRRTVYIAGGVGMSACATSQEPQNLVTFPTIGRGARTRACRVHTRVNAFPALGSQKGVTLIELLIAVMLLSLLSLAIVLTLRVALSAMSKSDAKLMSNRRVSSVER